MKLWFFVCLFICITPVLSGQYSNDFVVNEHLAARIPSEATHSTTSIAEYIQDNFKSDREKLFAIYSWVISNIKYDTDSMYHINWSMYPEEKIAATLRRRKGVCENYAALFTDIALKCGFPSVVVNGYTKEPVAVNRAGHSWSAVYVQDQWLLCDPTWDVGFKGNTRFFLISPHEFIDLHMPFDPLWQLLETPFTEQEFRQGMHFPKKRNKTFYSIQDSVKAFLQLDSLQQLEAATNRIKSAGIENERQKDWLAYNKMKMAIIYGEQDMNLYNSAVADLNKANAIFNEFVQYRNNRFIPLKPDAEINNLLDPIAGKLSAASKKIDEIGRSAENFQYDTGTLKSRLESLKDRVKEQQRFLNQYISTGVTERDKLFYRK